MKEDVIKKRVYATLVTLVTAFIFIQSLMPASASSAQSGFFMEIINNILLKLNITINENDLSFYIRKLAHFTEFFVLALFWFLYLTTTKSQEEAYFLTLGYGLMTGIADELIQSQTPGRAMQLSDVLIDFSGVLTFTILTFIIIKLYLLIQKRKYQKINNN